MSLNLDLLPQTAFIFFLLFARIGTLVMFLPGIGDRTLSPRMRLVFALLLTFVMQPLLQPSLPALPGNLNALMVLFLFEVLLGLAIGFSVRLIMSGLSITGSVIAMQTGLAFAENYDPSQGSQSALFATFLGLLATTLIFALDIHHLMIGAMHDSYQIFPPGKLVAIGDFANSAFNTISAAFKVAIRLSAPFLVFGLVFYLGIGILARLIPQVQVFFLAQPASIFLGLVLFFLLLSTLMLAYLNYFEDAIKPYLL